MKNKLFPTRDRLLLLSQVTCALAPDEAVSTHRRVRWQRKGDLCDTRRRRRLLGASAKNVLSEKCLISPGVSFFEVRK
jgi:hypothetical protein